MADITALDIRNEIESVVSSELTEISNRLSAIENLNRRNIDQDKNLRSNIDDLSGKTEILGSISNVSSMLEGLSTTVENIRTRLDSMEQSISNLSSQINR